MTVLDWWCYAKLPLATTSDDVRRKNVFYLPEPLYRVICSKGSSPEVFYYKGFLQISSKSTGEHPRGNITSEIHLNGRVMLLKGAIFFHPYIRSSTKTFSGYRRMLQYGEVIKKLEQQKKKINKK